MSLNNALTTLGLSLKDLNDAPDKIQLIEQAYRTLCQQIPSDNELSELNQANDAITNYVNLSSATQAPSSEETAGVVLEPSKKQPTPISVGSTLQSPNALRLKADIDALHFDNARARTYFEQLNKLIISNDISDKSMFWDGEVISWNIGCGNVWVDKVAEVKAAQQSNNPKRQRGCSDKQSPTPTFSEIERLTLCAYIIEKIQHAGVEPVLIQEGPSTQYLKDNNLSEDDAKRFFGAPAMREKGNIRLWTKSTTDLKNAPNDTKLNKILQAANTAGLSPHEYQIAVVRSGGKKHIYINVHFDWAAMYLQKGDGLNRRIAFLRAVQTLADKLAGDTNIEIDKSGQLPPALSTIPGFYIQNGGCCTLDLVTGNGRTGMAQLVSVNPNYYPTLQAPVLDPATAQAISEHLETNITPLTIAQQQLNLSIQSLDKKKFFSPVLYKHECAVKQRLDAFLNTYKRIQQQFAKDHQFGNLTTQLTNLFQDKSNAVFISHGGVWGAFLNVLNAIAQTIFGSKRFQTETQTMFETLQEESAKLHPPATPGAAKC